MTKKHPLIFKQYREQNGRIKSISKNLDDLTKPKVEFPVHNIA